MYWVVRSVELEIWLVAGGAVVGCEFGGDYLVESRNAGFQDALVKVSITLYILEYREEIIHTGLLVYTELANSRTRTPGRQFSNLIHQHRESIIFLPKRENRT